MSNALICVVDANVALKLFFVQPLSDVADALFAYLNATPTTRFYVPDFFYAECASAFANYVRLMKYSGEEAQQDMLALQALKFDVIPTLDLVQSALEIALAYRISGYDACYVALSAKINAPLVTADDKLVRAMKGKSFQVQALADFSIPPIS